ncbi:MAG TPA: TatD family hydrolase, partial [Verrucomicrobiae bacterium]|nr:TatD family hydrolase [Verrucomicrobiae bacterium]
MFFDTHCHLDDPSLRGNLPEVLSRAAAAGVSGIVVPGVSPAGWDAVTGTAGGEVYPAYGVHPMRAADFDQAVEMRLASLSAQAVAVGEIGLDYTLTVPRELQR